MKNKQKVIKAYQVNYKIPDNITCPSAGKLMLQGCQFYSRFNPDLADEADKLKDKIKDAVDLKVAQESVPQTYQDAYGKDQAMQSISEYVDNN